MTAVVGGISADQLQQYIDRIERLEEEKTNIGEDIKSVFAEAKSSGFDVKTIRAILRIRKMDSGELEEQEYLLELYKRALGMENLLGDEGLDDDEREAA
ncbi:MAG: DUF2312 domain-containing protein [Rickettsiales bacterium]